MYMQRETKGATCWNDLVSQALMVPSEEQECNTCGADAPEHEIWFMAAEWPLHSP